MYSRRLKLRYVEMHKPVPCGWGSSPAAAGLSRPQRRFRAATRTAFNMGWEVYGVEDGFDGLLTRNVRRLTRRDVRGILQLGGTILGTTNRRNPFCYPMTRNGKTVEKDRSAEVVRNFRALGLRALIAIGGDGTLGIAEKLFRKGVPIVGVPKTIDNDIPATVITFGFDTAVSTATDALDRLHTTAEAHKRVMVVEVMGPTRAGSPELRGLGRADGSDPGDPVRRGQGVRHHPGARARGPRVLDLVAAEGAIPARPGETRGPKEAGREVRLGGIAEWLAAEIAARCDGKETRSLVLGHLQRGGPPTSFDRLLGTRFGAAAMRLVGEKKFGSMVALDPPRVLAVPLRVAVGKGKLKKVPSDPTHPLRRDMGIGSGIDGGARAARTTAALALFCALAGCRCSARSPSPPRRCAAALKKATRRWIAAGPSRGASRRGRPVADPGPAAPPRWRALRASRSAADLRGEALLGGNILVTDAAARRDRLTRAAPRDHAQRGGDGLPLPGPRRAASGALAAGACALTTAASSAISAASSPPSACCRGRSTCWAAPSTPRSTG